MIRHKWGEPHRSEHKTERECEKGCGIVKVTRHEGNQYWVEFFRDGEKIEGRLTPSCERVKADV